MSFRQIAMDIKALKIQGASNVARAGLKAYSLKPSKSSIRKLLSLRPTEPMLRNVLYYAEKYSVNDALNLMGKFDINWDVIIEESINQTKLGAHLFPVFLFDFLYELKEDFKADIPKKVLDKVRNISEKMLVEYLKKKKKK